MLCRPPTTLVEWSSNIICEPAVVNFDNRARRVWLGPVLRGFWTGFSWRALFSILIHEPRGEKDVMKPGEDCQCEDCRIDGRKIVASVVRNAGGEHDGRDSSDLDCSVELAQPGGTEASEASHYVDGCGAHNDEYVAADHGHGYPEGDRQVTRQRLWKDTPHGKHDEGRHQHEFVGNGIENRAELRLLLEAASQKPVEAIGKTR